MLPPDVALGLRVLFTDREPPAVTAGRASRRRHAVAAAIHRRVLTLSLCALLSTATAHAGTYYVSPAGNNATGTGSAAAPWATLTHAAGAIPDNGSEIVLRDGSYPGTQVVSRAFMVPMTIRAETAYRARLVSSVTQHRVLYVAGANITLRGLELAGGLGGLDNYLVMITTTGAHDVVLEDCVLHDSYRNDILKLNDGAHHVTVRGCLFYNMPAPGDEHVDVNTVHDIVLENNIFMNDFAGSGRLNLNVTHPFVVIKNSGSTFVTRDITVRRNVFLNWEGAGDQAFLLLGEDGQPFHEVDGVLVENNLFLGNSGNTMSAALMLKGARDVTFRSNTIVGNLPAGAGYAIRLGREGSNPPNENVVLQNNVWADPTATMQRFASGAPQNTVGAVLQRNLYWNGGGAIPVDGAQVLNVGNDPAAVLADPRLPVNHATLVRPRWEPASGTFGGGYATIAAARAGLVGLHGTPALASAVVDRADPAAAPPDDILGTPRGSAPDLGAVEIAASSAVGDPLPVAQGRLAAHPNPFSARTTFRVDGDGTTAATVSIFDIRGRRVRTLPAGTPARESLVMWDGTDEHGQRLPAGTYLARAESGGVTTTIKLSLLP